jgi:hypothetical protein
MFFALLMLQAISPDPEQNRYACRLAEHRLLVQLTEYQALIARQFVRPRKVRRLQQRGEAVLRPYIVDVRDSIQDGDPAWVCDRIADRASDELNREVIGRLFGQPR